MVLGGKWMLWKIFVGTAFLTVFTGCNPVVVHSPDHVQGALTNNERKKLAADNSDITKKFAQEAMLYPSTPLGNSPPSRPKVCVSFSGVYCPA